MAAHIPIEDIHEFKKITRQCIHLDSADVRYGYFVISWRPYRSPSTASRRLSTLDEVRAAIEEIERSFDPVHNSSLIDPSKITPNPNPIRDFPVKYRTESPPPFHFLLPGDEGYTDKRSGGDIIED